MPPVAVTSSLSVNLPFDEPQNQNKRRTAVRRDSIEVRFARWTEKNPDIIELLLKFALEAKQAGRNRFGIAAIVERARWEISLDRLRGDETFKISNDFRSHLARLLMQMDSTLEGFFELRELRSVTKALGEPIKPDELNEPTDNQIPPTERKEESQCSIHR